MNWIEIKSREDLPKTQCECWVIDRCERITHETYYFGLGGFITSLTMSLRDPQRKITHYWIIEKPMSPKQVLLKEMREKAAKRNATGTIWTQEPSLRDLMYNLKDRQRQVRYNIEDGYDKSRSERQKDIYLTNLFLLTQAEERVREKRLEEFSYVHSRINSRS